MNIVNPQLPEASDRSRLIQLRELLGEETYLRMIWEMRDGEHHYPVKSTGSYPLELLRTAPRDDKVVAIPKQKAARDKSRNG